MLHNFWKIKFMKEYRQARTFQKWWKFVLSQFVLRKYFLAKLFVPLIKESVSPQCYAIFGKLNFWRNINRRGPYKNGENLYISICAKKIFFGKIICSTHQRKCFSTMLRNFWKIEFLKEYRQARTLQKWWKFVLSQFVLKNIFWQNYLFHSSKKVFLHNVTQFWKIEFLKEYRQARTLQKWYIFVLS